MDDERLLRHVRVIMQNIYRMNVHHEYAQKHLEMMIAELEGFDDQKMWIEYSKKVNDVEKAFRELNNGIDWEKEIEKYQYK